VADRERLAGGAESESTAANRTRLVLRLSSPLLRISLLGGGEGALCVVLLLLEELFWVSPEMVSQNLIAKIFKRKRQTVRNRYRNIGTGTGIVPVPTKNLNATASKKQHGKKIYTGTFTKIMQSARNKNASLLS
jgi:hypothetical protein